MARIHCAEFVPRVHKFTSHRVARFDLPPHQESEPRRFMISEALAAALNGFLISGMTLLASERLGPLRTFFICFEG
jgi:hypothetical protein